MRATLAIGPSGRGHASHRNDCKFVRSPLDDRISNAISAPLALVVDEC
jgi:hypothetical protein